jgi:hypothetical protein
MDENRYIISNIIRGVITQLAALENNGKLDIFLAKKADEETKVEIKDFIRLYNGKDNGIYNEKINNLIDKNNNKDKDNAYSILTNMEYVFLNTIEEAKEEEKKQKAKSEGFAKVKTQARVKAQTAGKNISTPKPVPKNKKATNK